ncbi:uncharacterized protein LOC117319392 [Pecten maximus]|uniref:uncharacterized protein LOC117319392 n=1 Tax=Pecten maximus TaxID=6579 RepID=UPI001457F00F|nr:uncharacterized protein LOC117319392 [Pecten maximus]
MQLIMQWIDSNNLEESSACKWYEPSRVSKPKRVQIRLQVQKFDLLLWNALSIAEVCSKVPERHCTTEGDCIVIEALEGDINKIVEEIKQILERIKKDRVTFPLQEDLADILKNKETEEYVTKQLHQKNQRCLWKIGAKCDTVDVYAIKRKEALNAGKTILESVSLVSLRQEFQHVEQLLNEEDCRKVLEKYRGKAKILSLRSEEVPLVATKDALEEILQVMSVCTKELSTVKSVPLEMPEGICKFVLERKPKFLKHLQEKYGVCLELTKNKRQLVMIGPKKNIPIAKSALDKEVGEIESRSERMKLLPQVLAAENEKTEFEAGNNCYLSVEKEAIIREPWPSHTWVLKNSLYLMLVPGDISETNVYAVMCPVDANMKPIGAGENILTCGGKSLEQDLQQSRGQSASKTKSDSWTCMSGETGSLHCQSIIYTEFPSQDVKGSRMSLSKSVVISRIKKTLEVADSKGVFSLAIPLLFSDVIMVSTCMQATAECLIDTVGMFSHLKEIYLYCDEKELENARSIFTQALLQYPHYSVDFSPLRKGGNERKSSIQLEIVEGSLTDQKVTEHIVHLNRAKAKDGSANSVESGSAFSAWYCPGVPALVGSSDGQGLFKLSRILLAV